MSDIQIYEGVFEVVQKEKNLIETFTAPEIIEKLYVFSPPEIQSWPDEKKEQFIKKTMMTIAHDEKLKPCFETNEGKLSLMSAVTKCCSTGLEIGGKHAYLIPQRDERNAPIKARFSIRAGGYYALLAGGDRPIFKDLRWSLVYTKDECSVDGGTGEVKHSINITGDRGDLLGCWVQIVKKTGQKEAVFFPMKKINQWKAKSKMQGGAWSSWGDEMAEQACIRHACDKYEQARDLLVASIYDNKEEDLQEDQSGFDKINEMIDTEEEEKQIDSDDSF